MRTDTMHRDDMTPPSAPSPVTSPAIADTLPAPAEDTAPEAPPLVTATYDASDNKIRLHPTSGERLDAETYARVKKAGFAWAPNQKLFVAPCWTPEREDLALELAGYLDDEESTLEERAAVRAERFGTYQEKRAADAERTAAYVEQMEDGSSSSGGVIGAGNWRAAKKAAKEAERIKAGKAKAVQLWETSEYWERRAKGAINHARYKELPGVRVRRIKGLEADERRERKSKAYAEAVIRVWSKPDMTIEKAVYVSNRDGGPWGTWDALNKAAGTPEAPAALETAKAASIAHFQTILSNAERWLVHLGLRLTFERAMLAASGHVMPPKAGRRKLAPLVNRPVADAAADFVTMTTAQWEKIHKEARCTRILNGERVRHVVRSHLKDLGIELPALPPRDPHDTRLGNRHLISVFLSDVKVTPAKVAASDAGPGEPDDDEGDDEGAEGES